MMAPISGVYRIYFLDINKQKAYLGFSIIEIPIRPKFYTVVGYRSENNPRVSKWTFTQGTGGPDSYKVYSAKHPNAAMAARGNAIVASEGAVDTFTFEAAEVSNSYRIKNASNKAWMLKLADGITQLHLSPNGAEVFYLEPA
ncbi:hypothetical protein TWF694_010366 [Orbilia ellipsospora]|uniref:Uncharacterized protein n=1 Tax=Orbilia ellipsospora TaxID=2528407 RepID=A0AAV9XAU6_9PEZI